MYGEDKTVLEELKNMVNELKSLKIEILPKSKKIKELNNSIEKMENQIKKVDETLLNNTQLDTSSNETIENTTEQQEIKTKEDSNLNILISNIDILTEKVNQAVKVEIERKAEEERKAKEEAEKKALEEEIEKFAGTYISIYSDDSITLDKDGVLHDGNNTRKPISIKKENDGSIHVITGYGAFDTEVGYTLYPIGVGQRGDTQKMRLDYLHDLAVWEYEKK